MNVDIWKRVEYGSGYVMQRTSEKNHVKGSLNIPIPHMNIPLRDIKSIVKCKRDPPCVNLFEAVFSWLKLLIKVMHRIHIYGEHFCERGLCNLLLKSTLTTFFRHRLIEISFQVYHWLITSYWVFLIKSVAS